MDLKSQFDVRVKLFEKGGPMRLVEALNPPDVIV